MSGMKRLFHLGEDRHEKGIVVTAWQPEGNLLATAGKNGTVHIVDRHGARVEELALPVVSPVDALKWDREGDSLAILQGGNPIISLWDLPSRSLTSLETSIKDPSYIEWSRVGPQLAAGGAKGNLMIYNKNTRRKVPVMGKHAKRIVCGAWSKRNELALGSEDRTLTISNAEGDTIQTLELKFSPREINFATQKVDGRAVEDSVESTISVNAGGKSIVLFNRKDPVNPVILAFQREYGDIVAHFWFGDGFMLVAFSEGFVVAISTLMQEIGEEKFCIHFPSFVVQDMAFSPILQRAAVIGDWGIKMVDVLEEKEVKTDAVAIDMTYDGRPRSVLWSPDGQLLTMTTRTGNVFNYLARLPAIYASYSTRVAYLSSLREVSVTDVTSERRVDVVPVALEPALLALGPHHLAVGINNHVVYYRCQDKAQVAEQEYLGKVTELRMNTRYAAVLSEYQVTLHTVEPAPRGSAPQRRTFPDREDDGDMKATCMALTDEFLMFGTDSGKIEMFYLEEWAILSGAALRHPGGLGIKSLHPNQFGTRALFIDRSNVGYLYNPVNAELITVPAFPETPRLVLWDTVDRHVIMVHDGDELHGYVYAPCSIKGPLVVKLGPLEISTNGELSIIPQAFPFPARHTPIVSCAGYITCQLPTGGLKTVLAPPYKHVEPDPRATTETMTWRFSQNLALLRLREAWETAQALDDHACLLALSGKAMEVMDIDVALMVYKQLGDAGMVMGLEQIRHVEDRNLLAGHIALLFGHYVQAQELFLSSSHPVAALDMHRDLLHWDQALKLAHTLAPHDIAEISLQYAQQLEFKGDYEQALQMYETAMAARDEDDRTPLCTEAQLALCTAGYARCTLRMGNLRKGISMVVETNDPVLSRDCAAILEANKATLSEAAALYERAQLYEKAAAIYIQIKSFAQAARIMGHVTLPKLHSQYAKACETERKFQEAAEAYEKAHDMDSVVRVCLEKLNDPEKAFSIVRRTASATGALMVAQYCQGIGDFRGAIEFLLMAQRSEEAFNISKAQNQVETYTTVLDDHISPDEARNVAHYYETRQDLGKAGRFYALCGQYARALKLFLQCGELEIDAAIDVVGKARNDMLTHMLIDFLMGETDGVSKDPNYIYRLYVALGNYAQAAKTAVIIARQEQDLGNYKAAHGILYETVRQLEDQRARVPHALRASFVLLHSYMLVKLLVRRDDHEAAARMLLRVANNISRFPSHTVPILTSTVIECQRAGLKSSAYEYATMLLMNAEYRQQVDGKFKKKIETIIRRPNKEEVQERLSPCPSCKTPIPSTELWCHNTKDALPMCIITGRHMEAEDWCICPNSRLPALYSEYVKHIELESSSDTGKAVDPVCGQPVSKDDLIRVDPTDVPKLIHFYNNSGDKDQEDDDTNSKPTAAGEQ